MARTAAAAVSINDADKSKTYLDAIYEANNEEIHIVWMTEKGSVLYDTDGTLGRNYLKMPEIQKAIDEGRGEIVQKHLMTTPKAMWHFGRQTIPFFAFRGANPYPLRFYPVSYLKYFFSSSYFL